MILMRSMHFPVLFVLVLVLAAPAAAQTFQNSMSCAMDYSRCEREADSQHHGGPTSSQPAACKAYTRCQAKAQCRANKCVCDRTHGSADPALAQEATAMCNVIVTPHGPNGCDRYAEPCIAALNAAAHPPAHPQAEPEQPGRGARFR